MKFSNERKSDETYEEYRNRLAHEQMLLKYYLRGRMVWNSNERGTYRKPKDE